MYYRLYFLNAAQRIAARDEFEADNDESAITIAGLLYDACSDLSSGFELWQGARRVVPDVKKQATAQPNQSSTAITLQLQSVVLEREEMLQQSQWLIARSKRLSARVDELRKAGLRWTRLPNSYNPEP